MYKIVFGLLLGSVFLGGCTSPSLFDKPESIVFDPATQSYFVTNSGNGTICNVNAAGEVSVLVEGFPSFLGIALEGDIIYAVENADKSKADAIHGFNKTSGKEVFTLSIPGTKQLNDVALDHAGNLFVSDRSDDKLYKINLAQRSYAVLVEGKISTPNGIYFDAGNNRLLVCNTVEKSSLYTVDPLSGETQILSATEYPHLDGITMDASGIVYVSSWSMDWESSKLLKYSGGQWAEVLANQDGIADISYNSSMKCIDMANYLVNGIGHFDVK